MNRIIAILLFFFSHLVVLAQNDSIRIVKPKYEISVLDSTGVVEKSYLFYSSDSVRFEQRTKVIKDSLINIGFLNTVVNVENTNKKNIYSINPNNRYKWFKLVVGKDKLNVFQDQRINLHNWEGQYVSPSKLAQISDIALKHLDNNGYPFANIKLDSIKFNSGDSLSAQVDIVLNKKIYFDTIKVNSKLELSYKYLENYLEIKKGDVFDKSKVDAISKKLSNLPFLKLDNPPRIAFFGNEATILLPLKHKKVNRFNFIIGLLPDKTGLRKYKLTGEIMAEMVNRLGKGERIYFKYKNLSQGKQSLRLDANYPYILDMPFGIDSKFNIYINEDSYRDVNFDVGVQYLFRGMNYLKTYWGVFSSRLIGVDSSSIIDLRRLPNKLDVATNRFGLELNYNNLDYRFSPRKGFEVKLDANIGQRKIIKNQQITNLKNDDIDFSNSYDSLKLSTYQFNLSAKISYYLAISSNVIFKFANNTAWKRSEVKLYQNELYRLGGNKILRGFDEESILGDIYSLSTAEIRLLIDKNSFLFAFLDYAFVRDPFATLDNWDNPYGFGVGINFDTKGGIIRLTTALGSRLDNPIDYKDVKIHLGYISLF